jgi:hypothetical protein
VARLFDYVCLMEGTPAVEVIDDVAPRPDEPVVRGQAANGFDRTELDTILRLAGVDNLVLAGIATDVAVESTVRAASDLGYRTIVVSDACTADSDEAHAHSLEVIQKWFGETLTADEVLSSLDKTAQRAGAKHAPMAKPQIKLGEQVVICSRTPGAVALQSLAVAPRARLARIEARELDIAI